VRLALLGSEWCARGRCDLGQPREDELSLGTRQSGNQGADRRAPKGDRVVVRGDCYMRKESTESPLEVRTPCLDRHFRQGTGFLRQRLLERIAPRALG